MKKKYLAIILVSVLVLTAGAGVLFLQKGKPSLAKACPDEWIEDRMPSASSDDSERQYLIFNGERKELKDYDLDWIKNNCSIQFQYVH